MKKLRGFTLVEVIISIAILGIISVGFLAAISSHYSYLNKTKEISEEVFLAQAEMEEKIDIVKDSIRENDGTITLKQKTIFADLGGIVVDYYEMQEPISSKKYYTLVSDVKPDILGVIELESLSSKLKQETQDSSVGYANDSFDIIGTFKNNDLYKFDHLLNVVEWYVSTDKFIMPMPKSATFDINDDIAYYSYYYPLFPRDYILIDNDVVNNFGTHNVTFPDLSSYAGRHIVFTATPGAKSGKIGKQLASKPIFISALPIIDDVVTHFDASYIDPTISDETDINGTNIGVKRWYDLSSIFGRNTPNQYAEPINTTQYPDLIKMEINLGFAGQYVRFDNDNKRLRIINQGTKNNDVYIYSVVRNRVITDKSKFLKNGTNDLFIEENQVSNPDE
ncbi:MAG: prepilin-type N-terminal cleavage/methylation domain-containing protein, partial [Acholeplasma sp.]|nr:prepilin-type N-terminal cleavage/methylation domain-containing protein [Acholeplasma sp.]